MLAQTSGYAIGLTGPTGADVNGAAFVVVAQSSAGGSSAGDGSGDGSTADIFLWSAVLLAFLVVGMAVVLWLKRRMQADDEPATVNPAGFTLSDLRRLHKSGQMSDDEFERAKVKIVAAAKRAEVRESATASAAERRTAEDLRKARERDELRRRFGAAGATPSPSGNGSDAEDDDDDDGQTRDDDYPDRPGPAARGGGA
jgi:hypothetical protein